MSHPAQTIAITGASGFVGGYLARHFHARGARVLAFGRRSDSGLPAGVVYRSWDITKPYPFGREDEISAVVHCAGSVSEWGSYREMFRTNVLGTANVLSAFANSDLFLHVSSASVYGTEGRKISVCEDEPFPARYLNHYSTTKMLGERTVEASAHPNRVILRPHIIYGPGDTTLLPRLLKAHRMGRLIVLGDGRNVLSLTHVANLAQAVELLLGRHWGFEVFNICDGRADSVDQVLKTLIDTMGWRASLLHVSPSIARTIAWVLERSYSILRLKASPLLTPYIVEHMSRDFTMDTAKARAMLDYAPQCEYPEGFREVHDWLAADPALHWINGSRRKRTNSPYI